MKRFVSTSRVLNSKAFLESEQAIKSSKKLTKLLRGSDLTSVVKSTLDLSLPSAQPSSKAAIDLTADNLSFEPINPKIIYREKMRTVRREYQEQAHKTRAALLAKKLEQQQQAKQERALFDADVEKRKRERILMESNIVFDKEIISQKEEQDPIIEQRQAQWDTWVKERKQNNFKKRLEYLQASSEKRLEHLVFLFQAAKDFVTLSNLEARLDSAFRMDIRYNTNMNQAIANAMKSNSAKKLEGRMDALDSLMNVSTGGKPLNRLGAEDLVNNFKDEEDNAPSDMVDSVREFEREQQLMKQKLQEKMFH